MIWFEQAEISEVFNNPRDAKLLLGRAGKLAGRAS
jgi:hypothetical protein